MAPIVLKTLDNVGASAYIIDIPGDTRGDRKGVMQVKMRVNRVLLPVGSTVGLVFGQPEGDGTKVAVAGVPWRAAIDIGEAITEAEEPVVIEFDDWMILGVMELPD